MLPVGCQLRGVFEFLLEHRALAHQRGYPGLDQTQQGDLLDAEGGMAAQGQAQGAFGIQLDVDVHFIGEDVQAEITLVVIGLLEALGGDIFRLAR